MGVQDLLSKYYDVDNLVTIEISMPDADWATLKNTGPHYGWRADATKDQVLNEHHYDWFKTTSVSVSGTKYPTQKQSFSPVSIVKKSFAGSISNVKPSLKLEFSRLTKKEKNNATPAELEAAKKNEAAILALVGTKDITLNNSVQDPSYVRQPLGYEVFRQGGIPYARCNFAKVIVNGRSLGIYVNLEQIQEPYMQRNFNNDKGNLYETEWRFDLTKADLDKTFNQEGFSDFEDQKDLGLAISTFDKGIKVAKQVIAVDQVIRVLAMQAVVKHWDGYPNNTFVYNDTVPVENPKAENVKLKLIPSGIDGIFLPDRPFVVKNEGVLSKLVLNDSDTNKQLTAALQDSAKVFDKFLGANLSFVDKLAGILKIGGVDKPDDVAKAIDVVRKELNGVKAGLGAFIKTRSS
ncbi:MAG: hypothetical protein HETSPECPRED_008471 [Heterodermia speciosa]|uniref:Uncharacterized protein n=1 Tax=Heterodermia speciosa TaxID=116794 RepID=A0A8H3FXY7_9LECA|nr:MAG: hypothetical protein HETSPECPRED_008471 [Heterodermia speciosa]